MALSRGRLTDEVSVVAAGTTVGLCTVANSKKVYVRSIIAHNDAHTDTVFAHVYYRPNGHSITKDNRLFQVAIAQSETVYIEPAYPIVLETTGDELGIGCTLGSINVFVNGDREA
ncbi:hypothetical protein CMO86_09590 [Candidatus Woesearchaeota archaeon]|jgi:hypothetical protein|nr:hypothetical protein [Candidatus Woesearchaeota archaeon]|tara:strand:- start:409 stop:753 length:345 start_codon:yes stop_codon:yes gene_type:complete